MKIIKVNPEMSPKEQLAYGLNNSIFWRVRVPVKTTLTIGETRRLTSWNALALTGT